MTFRTRSALSFLVLLGLAAEVSGQVTPPVPRPPRPLGNSTGEVAPAIHLATTYDGTTVRLFVTSFSMHI